MWENQFACLKMLATFMRLECTKQRHHLYFHLNSVQERASTDPTKYSPFTDQILQRPARHGRKKHQLKLVRKSCVKVQFLTRVLKQTRHEEHSSASPPFLQRTNASTKVSQTVFYKTIKVYGTYYVTHTIIICMIHENEEFKIFFGYEIKCNCTVTVVFRII